MIADTEAELHLLAERIGMRREWYQGDHYDLRPDGRALALAFGAKEMPTREMARRICGARKARRRASKPTMLLARAKINPFLAVGPPDARGWHPLRTIFQEVDLADALIVEEAEAESITFSVAGIPERNTITRTLELLRERTTIPPLRIHVEKRIPAESGLGGGSADAAAILRHLGRDLPDLAEIALRVGADVPFFLVGGRARAEGYGERLTPLPDLPRRPLVLARPEEGCPTAAMFGELDAAPRDFREFPEGDRLYNDFERVAPCASLDLIDRLLVHGAEDAGLTGSGSVVFGRFADDGEADRASEAMRDEAPWIYRAHTVPRLVV